MLHDTGAGGKTAAELKNLEDLRMREKAGELEEKDVPDLERLAKAEKTNATKLQKTNQGKQYDTFCYFL